MNNEYMTQMYAIRLKPGTYPAPLAGGMYVASSALPSEIRFTPEIQFARTWGSYQDAYSYVDENLYGVAKVVKVVSMHSLLADIKRVGANVVTASIPQHTFKAGDKKPASTEPSLHHQQPQSTTQQDKKVQLAPGTSINFDSSSVPTSDDTLHLYRLYRFYESPLLEDPPLAEEWATEAEVLEVNEEAMQRGLIWVKAQD
jgi:hypothetical protein